jgi:hypothetical protein
MASSEAREGCVTQGEVAMIFRQLPISDYVAFWQNNRLVSDASLAVFCSALNTVMKLAAEIKLEYLLN